MLLERTHPTVELSSTSSLLEVHLVFFIACFIVIVIAFVAAPYIHLFWIVSSVQTCCLYCHYHSILVRPEWCPCLRIILYFIKFLITETTLTSFQEYFQRNIPVSKLFCQISIVEGTVDGPKSAGVHSSNFAVFPECLFSSHLLSHIICTTGHMPLPSLLVVPI